MFMSIIILPLSASILLVTLGIPPAKPSPCINKIYASPNQINTKSENHSYIKAKGIQSVQSEVEDNVLTSSPKPKNAKKHALAEARVWESRLIRTDIWPFSLLFSTTPVFEPTAFGGGTVGFEY